jgi:phosphoglycolate phosphatase-like HAD superfamily hydrolase
MKAPVVVFDFDGVICDSTDECLVTSWNTWERWNGRSGLRAALDDFSAADRAAFRPLRPYVRGAGEYYVLRRCLEEGLPICSQLDFEGYCWQWHEHFARFKEMFYHERAQMRADNLEAWLALHPVWTDVVDVFTTLHRERRAYIATLKDGESVRLILEAHNAALPSERILDESRVNSKLEALEMICEAERRPPNEVVFLDDNATHLLAPARAGFACYLTAWGTTLPEHLEIAARERIPVIARPQDLMNPGPTA